MKKFITYIVIALVAIGLIIVWAIGQDKKNIEYKAQNNTENLEQVGQVFENQGQMHIKVGESHPDYNSNPPTSGWHWVNPASWGVHNKPIPDEQALHNLEHGGIWISYKNIDDETKEELKKIAKVNPDSIIVSPRDKNDSKIVLASWTRLESMDTYNRDRILAFIERNKNKSPEPLAR